MIAGDMRSAQDHPVAQGCPRSSLVHKEFPGDATDIADMPEVIARGMSGAKSHF